MAPRTWDVVLYGATGFAGGFAAKYLANQAPKDLRWAIAGRSEDKLERLKANLGRDDVGIVVADSSSPDAIGTMAENTAVLISTVGPFALYGTPVVEAAVKHGTHYVDITGETPWVRDLIDQFHDQAAVDGTRIVPMCGYDSIPSDMGAWMVADFIRRTWDEDTAHIHAAFSIAGGGLNGGTFATLLNDSPGSRRKMLDVQLLNPSSARSDDERKRSSDVRKVKYHEDFERWLCPFIMAVVNTRVVRRSNALFGLEKHAYGPAFTYQEWMNAGSRSKAVATTAGLGGAMMLLSTKPGRALARKLGPKPGQGPSETQIERGFIRTRFVGRSASGRRVDGLMEYPGDAGNKATVLMLVESALALALQLDELPDRGGVLTPAVAFEDVLLQRLRAAGMRWDVAPA